MTTDHPLVSPEHAYVVGLLEGSLRLAGVYVRNVTHEGDASAEMTIGLPADAPVPHVHVIVLPPHATEEEAP